MNRQVYGPADAEASPLRLLLILLRPDACALDLKAIKMRIDVAIDFLAAAALAKSRPNWLNLLSPDSKVPFQFVVGFIC